MLFPEIAGSPPYFDWIWSRMILDAWRGIMNDEERIYKWPKKNQYQTSIYFPF